MDKSPTKTLQSSCSQTEQLHQGGQRPRIEVLTEEISLKQQEICVMQDTLNDLEIAVNELYGKYLRVRGRKGELHKEAEKLDRELAKLDGRHKRFDRKGRREMESHLAKTMKLVKDLDQEELVTLRERLMRDRKIVSKGEEGA